MNTIRPYIIPGLIVLIVVLCFISLRQCESKKEVVAVHDNTQFRTIIHALQTDTATLRTINRELMLRIIQDSTEHAKVISVGLNKIVSHRAAAVVLRPQVQPAIDSLPILKEFVALQDSTITELLDVNKELTASYVAQVKGLREQLEINGQIQTKNDEIMRLYEDRIAKLMKQNRKEQRGKRFWRSAAVVLAATTAVLILAK